MTIEVTLDDLQAAGFVPWQYWGQDKRSSLISVQTHSRYLVHSSVANELQGKAGDQKDHPVLMPQTKTTYRYAADNITILDGQTEILFWEAKWGAQYFRLRTYLELHGFMQLFNYQS